MKLIKNQRYQQDLNQIIATDLPWKKMKNKSILISGASGLIGSCLIDALMKTNTEQNLNCNIYALGRNAERAHSRFDYCWSNEYFHFFSCDINNPIAIPGIDRIDYILHLASNTHPLAYANDPIGTITANIFGTYQLLEFATTHYTERFVLASSNEIYGENRGDQERFDETYCGYIDSNTMRAGYPESKRCAEALCQAYIRQKNVDTVIARFTRTYGPTMQMTDSKAISQFIKKGLNREDIVLKSEGTQFYSYTYVSDAVTGLLTILLCGNKGEAYNIADEKSDIMLKDLAGQIAEIAGTKVIFELPDDVERAGYSKATKARLDGSKLQELGWKASYSMQEGLEETLAILNEADGKAGID